MAFLYYNLRLVCIILSESPPPPHSSLVPIVVNYSPPSLSYQAMCQHGGAMYGVSTAFVRSLGYYGLHSVTVPALTTSVTGYYVNLTESSTTPLNRLLFNRLRQP